MLKKKEVEKKGRKKVKQRNKTMMMNKDNELRGNKNVGEEAKQLHRTTHSHTASNSKHNTEDTVQKKTHTRSSTPHTQKNSLVWFFSLAFFLRVFWF